MRVRQRYRRLAALALLCVASMHLAGASMRLAAQPNPDDDPRLPQWRQTMRTADSLLSAGQIGPAIGLLEDLRGSPPVRARSEDYPRLLMLLARAYAWHADVERAIERVSEAIELGYPAWQEVATSADFVLVRSDDRFARLVADARRHAAPWERLFAPAAELFRWSDTLSLEMRAYGVSAIWSSVRYAYAYADRLRGASWDSIYIATLREALATPSTLGNYRLLQRMAASARDGHTAVAIPPELEESTAYVPPLRTSLVGTCVLVTAIISPANSGEEIDVGDEIIAIDGVPVVEYVARYIDPYVSASSDQDRVVRSYDHMLLNGPADSRVRLTIRGVNGRVRDVNLIRSFCREDLSNGPTVDIRRLPGNVGYVAINTFSDEYVVPLFDAALGKLHDADALIIDVRNNTGGNTRLAFEVLGRIISGPFETHRWETPVYRSYFHARGRSVEWYREPAGYLAGSRGHRYAGPVVLLVGARTLSAAENFVVAFDYAQRGVVVGEPTAGSTGHTLEVLLPAGGALRVTTTRDYYPDGRRYNGVGVVPTIVARPTCEDVRARRDVPLDAALAAARSLIAKSTATRREAGNRRREAQR